MFSRDSNRKRFRLVSNIVEPLTVSKKKLIKQLALCVCCNFNYDASFVHYVNTISHSAVNNGLKF